MKKILGLAFQLAKSNFKLRNEGSFLGIFWYLLEPFFLFLIILIIRVGSVEKGLGDYPLYLLSGLIMYNFFSMTTSTSTTIIKGKSKFIKSIKINHESLIISKILEGVFSHFFEIILFIGFMIYFKASLVWMLIYPLIFGFYMIFILGVSFVLAALGVFVNDLRNAWRVVTRLLFFATPLFYSIEEGSLLYRINLFNPLFYFISVTRKFIIDNIFPPSWMLGVLVGSSLLSLVAGLIIFEKYKDRFAEFV